MYRLLLALLALTALALADDGHHHHSAAEHGIKCVQCSSQINPDCAEGGSILDVYTKVCPKIKDGELKGTEAIGCRKTLQRISQGDTENTVYRECAYIGEDVDGQRKTGNSGILLYHYQCSNGVDENDLPCNSVSGFSLAASSLVALVVRLFL